MPFWISLLIPLLVKLAEWLIAKRNSNDTLTSRQQQKINKVLYECRRINLEAVAMGCHPEDDGENVSMPDDVLAQLATMQPIEADDALTNGSKQ